MKMNQNVEGSIFAISAIKTLQQEEDEHVISKNFTKTKIQLQNHIIIQLQNHIIIQLQNHIMLLHLLHKTLLLLQQITLTILILLIIIVQLPIT